MTSDKINILKSHGGVENFSRRKLYKSLIRSGLPPKQCQVITDKVTREINEGARTRDIYKKTLRLVNERSSVAAVHYSLKRALFDLGPTGYHFEFFVARYFKELGYTTMTSQTLNGRFVKHEVDVIAEKRGLNTYVECKFHNRIGLKNDIKVALYVKARWDDLKEGPQGKKLESFVLASNTAFSLDAITYANGVGLNLLGVNAPVERSFLEEIKAMHLYPITSLRRLNKATKQELLARDVLLARELPDHIDILLRMGMAEESIDALLSEIKLLKDSKL